MQKVDPSLLQMSSIGKTAPNFDRWDLLIINLTPNWFSIIIPRARTPKQKQTNQNRPIKTDQSKQTNQTDQSNATR